MHNSAQTPKISRLRILLYERRISASRLAEGTGLSASLCEKLAANRRRPSQVTIDKIELFLDARIWSSPAEFKRRRESSGPAQAAPVPDSQTAPQSKKREARKKIVTAHRRLVAANLAAQVKESPVENNRELSQPQ